jgi:tRNA threonylcarbamoyladenosine biosynthesis protein TsaB
LNILAIDTADKALSVALAGETGVWYTEVDAGSRHSELLMECVDGLCKSASLSPKDLSLVACMKGPGSFTGLRIGFSSAKGLALSLGIPLIAIPTLDCLAYPFSVWAGLVIPAMDAKKSCFFAALYRGGEKLSDYIDAPPKTLAKMIETRRISCDEQIILTGSGADILFSCLTEHISLEHTMVDPLFQRGKGRELLEIAKSIIINDNDDIDSGPVYLRKSDAELNRDQNGCDHKWLK